MLTVLVSVTVTNFNQKFENILCFSCPSYIHNWSLQFCSQYYDLASHTTYVACVNYMQEGRDLQFKVDSEWQDFWEAFHANFI